jgi:hypothetical protein
MDPVGWRSLIPVSSEYCGQGRFPIAAYSEFMPPPRIGLKPYGSFELDCPLREDDPWGWLIPNREVDHQVTPGFESIARQLLETIVALTTGRGSHRLGRLHLENNPYWAASLTGAAAVAQERFVFLSPLALAKTQDDKGRVRWSLFGASSHGPGKAFWRSFFTAQGAELPAEDALGALRKILAAVYGLSGAALEHPKAAGFRIRPSDPAGPWDEGPLPSWVREFVLDESDLASCRYLLTFTPFTRLPAPIQAAYLSGAIALLPSPATMAFWGSPLIGKLRASLPYADQLLLLQFVARHEGRGIRVPQSGWLHHKRPGNVEHDPGLGPLNDTFRRTNRWQRVLREDDDVAFAREDHVHTVLFSTHPDDVRLYGKPMARNAQIWSSDFEAVLHGPTASGDDIDRAIARMKLGGSFGYRFFYPPMQVGTSAVFWHRPLIAHWNAVENTAVVVDAGLNGYLSAVPAEGLTSQSVVELSPRFEVRSGALPAANLPHRASDAHVREFFEHIFGVVEHELGALGALTFGQTSTRAFEVRYWKTIADLAEGRYLNKNSGDCVTDPPTLAARSHLHPDLDPLANHLLAYYRGLADRTGMTGRVLAGDMPFQWKTDFAFPWMGGWLANREGKALERDLITVIPGKNRGEAVIMADHYDTAYMEDVYGDRSGVQGSGARLSAAGADDNHSATAALMMGARIFFDLSRRGGLDCDIWLVHLTGEEFPADCLGARALTERLIERTLELRQSDGSRQSLSPVKVRGVFVLDMIAHNNDHAPDVFQIAPGTTKESLMLARIAHQTACDWRAGSEIWNRRLRGRCGKGRRSPNGSVVPAMAQYLSPRGEVRLHDNPRSTLFNTDGQIFSDAGLPTVLFMENYDINREGYHDTHDTMANIDLDYGTAVAAIAIETVARAASVRSF